MVSVFPWPSSYKSIVMVGDPLKRIVIYCMVGLRNPYKHISLNENYNNVQGKIPLEIYHSPLRESYWKRSAVISRNNKEEILEVTSSRKNFEDNFSCRNRFNLVPFPQQIWPQKMDFLKKFDSFILFSQKRFLNCTLEINVVFFPI